MNASITYWRKLLVPYWAGGIDVPAGPAGEDRSRWRYEDLLTEASRCEDRLLHRDDWTLA
jgi:hypothetical protein